MKKILYTLFALLLITSTTLAKDIKIEFVAYTDVEYDKKPKDSPVDLFFEERSTKEYTVIGEIIGFIRKGEDVRPALKKKAREVGGDGAIDIEMSREKPTGNGRGILARTFRERETGISIKCKVIRYKK